MKRAIRPTPILLPTTSKGNNVATSYKHSLQAFQDLPNNIENNNCFVVEEPQHLKIYLPK
jgi:hypothetical protein